MNQGRTNLTAIAVQEFKPDVARYEIPDAKVAGLRLVVQPSGHKSWCCRYSFLGRGRKLTIGAYPVIGLGEARELAGKALRRVAGGEDPAATKTEARRLAATGMDTANLFEAVWHEYRDRHVESNLKASTAGRLKRIFEKEFVPRWKGRQIAEIEKRDVLALLDDVSKRGPHAANTAAATIAAFFNWAVHRDIIATSPCAAIKKPNPERSRDRVLTDDEVRWLWRACEEVAFPFGRVAQMLLLTGARREEVRAMTDRELKLGEKLWTLPGARTKNSVMHEVHLSAMALETLARTPRIKSKAGFVFTTNGETPPSGFSRSKRKVDSLMLKFAREEAKRRGDNAATVEIRNWCLHDLRRTMASGMARLGLSLPVIEKCLNHVSGSFAGIVGVYQRHSFTAEKVAAFDAWSRHIESLVTGRAGNVVTIRRTHSLVEGAAVAG